MNEEVVVLSKRRKFSALSDSDRFEYVCESQKKNEEVVFGKRRKGADDTDVGVSAAYTEMADQLAAIQAIASATKNPEVFLALKRKVEAIRERILAFINSGDAY